jgi:hypothetical protein
VTPEPEDFRYSDGPGLNFSNNRCRIEFAKRAIEELAISAAQPGCTGSIGVEIPFKDGILGRVKQVQVVLSRERRE